MRRAIAAIATLVFAVATGVASADAASVGSVATRMFSAGGTVTFAPGDRTVADLSVATTGSPAVLTAATVTVTGAGLEQLSGQSITLLLLDASPTPVRTVTTTLVTGSTLTVGAGTASITVPISGSTTRSAVTAWAVFIAGTQVLPLGATSTTRYVTVGTGSIPVVPWGDTLVPPGSATNATVGTVTISTNTTVTQCVTIPITGTSATPTAWSIRVDFAQPPYYGFAPDQVQYATVQSTAGTVWTLVGTTHGGRWDAQQNNALLTSSQSVIIVLCQHNAAVAPDRPEAYSATAAVAYGTWTSNEACKSVTVTGNGTYPFYFGWSVPFDMADAVAYLKSFDAASPRRMSHTPDTVSPAFGSNVTSYTVSNHRDDAVKGTDSRVVVICLDRH